MKADVKINNPKSGVILKILEESYPEAECELNFGTPFQLLVAVVLSAQCTDKRVNAVTRTLFKDYPTPEAFNALDTEILEKLIYTCGFYRNKAKAIKLLSEDIAQKFGGEVPSTVEGLMSLAGVGRKTANVVYSVAFGGEAIAVDTHVFRVSHRLGLSNGNTPDKVMEDLMREFPSDKWYALHHAMIFHGRYTCKSRKPDCGNCRLTKYCVYYADMTDKKD